jgi:hypothetical protein
MRSSNCVAENPEGLKFCNARHRANGDAASVASRTRPRKFCGEYGTTPNGEARRRIEKRELCRQILLRQGSDDGGRDACPTIWGTTE